MPLRPAVAILLSGCLLSVVGAADAVPFDFQRALLSASEGGDLPQYAPPDGDGRRTGFFQGFGLRLDGAVVQAHRLVATLAPVAVGESDYLLAAELVPGPSGPSPDRVVFDTSECRIDSVNFRGRLTPIQARLQRRTIEGEGAARLLVYDLVFDRIDDFSGLIRNERGEWVPLRGRAHRMIAEAVVGWNGEEAASPRFRSIQLVSAGPDDRVELFIEDDPASLAAESRSFVLHFDDLGRMMRIQGGDFLEFLRERSPAEE